METPEKTAQKAPEGHPRPSKEALAAVSNDLAIGRERVKDVPDALTWGELVAAFNRYQNPDAKFCFAWLYLTGQRVTEGLRTLARHVEVRHLDGREFMVVDTLTLKNKQTKHRTLGIPMDGREKEMVELVLERIKKMAPEARIIPVTPEAVWHRLKHVSVLVRSVDATTFDHKEPSLLGIYPHYLRHCRASHLATDYNYDHKRLMKWFGWSSPNMPDYYITSNWTWLARGFEGTP